MVYHSPKWWKEFNELRKRNELAQRSAVKEDLACSGSSRISNKEEARAQLKVPSSNLDQAISHANSTRGPSDVRPDPGHKLPDSTMVKQRASSSTSRDQEQPASSSKRVKHQAASVKPQATSVKLQATSVKLQDS